MALPRHLKNGLTPLEIEFLAENELIEIEAAIDTRTDLELLSVSALFFWFNEPRDLRTREENRPRLRINMLQETTKN